MTIGTLWRRAVRRVIRRSTLYRADRSPRHELLLVQAVRLANDLSRGIA